MPHHPVLTYTTADAGVHLTCGCGLDVNLGFDAPAGDAHLLAVLHGAGRPKADMVRQVEASLDDCFCTDGRGLPECGQCVTGRRLLASLHRD